MYGISFKSEGVINVLKGYGIQEGIMISNPVKTGKLVHASRVRQAGYCNHDKLRFEVIAAKRIK